jgi:hypothetical protein
MVGIDKIQLFGILVISNGPQNPIEMNRLFKVKIYNLGSIHDLSKSKKIDYLKELVKYHQNRFLSMLDTRQTKHESMLTSN